MSRNSIIQTSFWKLVNLINKGVGRSNANLVDNVVMTASNFFHPKHLRPQPRLAHSAFLPGTFFHPSFPESFLLHRRPQCETPLRVRPAAVGMQLYNSSGDSSAFFNLCLNCRSGNPAGYRYLANILAHSCRFSSASIVCIALEESSTQLTHPKSDQKQISCSVASKPPLKVKAQPSKHLSDERRNGCRRKLDGYSARFGWQELRRMLQSMSLSSNQESAEIS